MYHAVLPPSRRVAVIPNDSMASATLSSDRALVNKLV